MSSDAPRTAQTPVSLDDVAKVSGVSRATASRALNDRDGVRPAVRERVRSVAAQLGYRPNRAAQFLASGRASVIGLVMPSDELRVDPYGASLIQAVAGAADRHEEGLMLLLTHNEPNRAVRHTLHDGLIDGIVVSSVALGAEWVEQLLESAVPAVLVGTHPTRTDVATVEVESFDATIELVEHLLDQGCRRIAHVTGLLDREDARQRLDGFREAHRRHDIDLDEQLIVDGAYTRASGRSAMHKLLPAYPDAVVAANDEMAIGVMDVVKHEGLSIPGDIAIAGFDGTAAVEALDPSLTTVRQPFDELAETAVSTLVSILAGVDAPTRQMIRPQLVIGASTARSSIQGGEP